MHDLNNNNSLYKNQPHKNTETNNLFNSKKLYSRYNIEIARRLDSVNASVMLSELVDEYIECKSHNKLSPDIHEGFHWCIFDKELIKKNTALSFLEQENGQHLLVINGFIQFSRQGKDGVLHFRLSPVLINNSKEIL